MRGRDKFKRAKPLINFFMRVCGIIPFYIRKKLFEHFRMTKGIKGLVIRYVLKAVVTMFQYIPMFIC
jgi:hypothetical protein